MMKRGFYDPFRVDGSRIRLIDDCRFDRNHFRPPLSFCSSLVSAIVRKKALLVLDDRNGFLGVGARELLYEVVDPLL